MVQPKIIAIDGPAASGKGTLARGLAEELGFAHMDTGALYRAVAFEVIEKGKSPKSEAEAMQGCKFLKDKILNSKENILSNPVLRSEEVGQGASYVATMPKVRDALVDIQRQFARKPPHGYDGAVLDGRDIGTVICPDAPLKLFITASPEIRAQRRRKELQSRGLVVTYEAVLEDMRARDERDSGRKVAPLRPAPDAIVIDSSDLAEDQMLEMALTYAIKAFGADVSSGS